MNSLALMKVIYAANTLVAGWISLTSLFMPRVAQVTVFSNSIAYSEAIRLVGALWGGIFVLSALGLFFPQSMSLVLLFQLIYKTSWLLVVALPAYLTSQPYPKAMAAFFLVWVVVLPFAIPWGWLFSR
ncbi:hypothetical protein [Spirosoma sordidisoli]|uniref:DUF4345 domain-containing protein n=1 Tax=Spirosoma sordidisoli TaxID=2502893 RepID=A0A4Q2ULV2_9BACT|nr:hypothetical protein [Spirosoma sordidisoli]RYC68500.1 hypothetical protein EQG79_19295 [Spirosoma sordidisoli]